ncbi:MAG: RlmI/RlmK family 23S rRNA methyltransferase, partial [Pseudoruegeria sp.]
MSSSFPVVRLKPKANARAIRHGFPWVYENEIVIDRRTRNIEAGALAILEDGERRPMGVVAVNPNSKIFCRMLDRNPEAVIDQAWLVEKFARALALREQIYDAPFYRLI